MDLTINNYIKLELVNEENLINQMEMSSQYEEKIKLLLKTLIMIIEKDYKLDLSKNGHENTKIHIDGLLIYYDQLCYTIYSHEQCKTINCHQQCQIEIIIKICFKYKEDCVLDELELLMEETAKIINIINYSKYFKAKIHGIKYTINNSKFIIELKIEYKMNNNSLCLQKLSSDFSKEYINNLLFNFEKLFLLMKKKIK